MDSRGREYEEAQRPGLEDPMVMEELISITRRSRLCTHTVKERINMNTQDARRLEHDPGPGRERKSTLLVGREDGSETEVKYRRVHLSVQHHGHG
jgi:hypothetical protein